MTRRTLVVTGPLILALLAPAALCGCGGQPRATTRLCPPVVLAAELQVGPAFMPATDGRQECLPHNLVLADPAGRLGALRPGDLAALAAPKPFAEDVWHFRAGIAAGAFFPLGDSDDAVNFYCDLNGAWRIISLLDSRLDVMTTLSAGFAQTNEGSDSHMRLIPFVIEARVGWWLLPERLQVYAGGGFAYGLNSFQVGAADGLANNLSERHLKDIYGPVLTLGLEVWNRSRPRVILGLEGKYFLLQDVEYLDRDLTGTPVAWGSIDQSAWLLRFNVQVPF
jgi:hypothetical protein